MKRRHAVAAEPHVIKADHKWTGKTEPPTPPRTYEHLDFEPQPMVGWFKPTELAKAGLQVVLSSAFGAYADKREVELVLGDAQWHDYSEDFEKNEDGLWFDYVADLGDGWDSTYTIARLLAEKTLNFTEDGQCTLDPNAPTKTRRGRVLVMGGDEVYPTSSPEEYTNRMIEPYRCALPYVPDYREAPHLYLIPGNHDWYDGLGSFFKLFCYEQWVGGWKTWQRRSYFALKLAAGDEASNRPDVWLWGIDTQLSSKLDQPQLDYFAYIAEKEMKPKSKIILCAAEPSWVYVDAKTQEQQTRVKRARNEERKKTEEDKLERKKKEIYAGIGYLEAKVIKPNNHDVTVGLAGDWHNYTRYESEDGKQRFVSGGGGAYLYPTHHMPKDLELPKAFSENGISGTTYKRKAIFPGESDSYWLVTRSLFFSFFRLNWGFTFLLGVIYLLLSWIVQSVSKVGRGTLMEADETLLERFSQSFDLGAFIQVIAHSPESVVFLVLIIAGMIGLSNYETISKRIIHGGIHGLAHIGLFLLLFYLCAKINLVWGADFFDSIFPGDWGKDHPLQVIIFGAEMLLFGSTLGGIVLGFYLWFSNRVLKIHDNEVLLCQSDPDYKNFLRFHLAKDGTLTIYPVGVKRVNRKRSWKFNKVERLLAAWKLNQEARDGEAWIEPREGVIQNFAQLIEDPITLPVTKNGGNAHG